MKIKRLYLLFITICLANMLWADTIVCPISTPQLKISDSLKYYIDTTEALSIEDIQLVENTLFTDHNKKIVKSRKRLRGTIWTVIYLKNTSNKTLDYTIKIEDPYINQLHFYTFSNSEMNVDKSGIDYPFNIRVVNYRAHISKITIPSNTTIKVYIQASKYAKAIRLNIEMWETEHLLANLSESNLVTGIFYGVLVLLLLLILIVYSQFREVFLIGYFLYLLGSILHSLANSGLLFQYFLDGIDSQTLDLMRPWAMFIGYSGLVMFVNHLFNRPIIFRRLNKACLWFHWLYTLAFIIGSTFYYIIPRTAFIEFITFFSLSAAFIGIFGIVISFLIVLLSFYKERSVKAAILVVVYFLMFLYVGFLTTNVYFFEIHRMPPLFVENVSIIFSILETLLMSIAITFAINQMLINRDELKLKVERQKLEMAQSIIEGAENERERIAKELHDSIGSYLSTIGIFTDQLEQKEGLKSKIRNLVDETHSEVRRISDDLLPMAFNRFGLIEAIRNLCKDLDNSNALKVDFNTNLKKIELTNFQQLNIYRIVQELTNNTIKHAKATELTIQFIKDDEGWMLTVEDNGLGFDLEKVKKEKITAFHSLEARTKSLEASLFIESSESGTIVIIEKMNES